MTPEATESRIRSLMLALTALIFLAIPVELWLEDHTGEPLQLVPFALCTLGLIAVATALLRPGKSTLIALRAAMIPVALGGLLGMWLHFSGNYAFAQETRPNATGMDLLVPALKGANPLLAPGVLVFAALLAVAATYYHPALRSRSTL